MHRNKRFFLQFDSDDPKKLHDLLRDQTKKDRHKRECIQLLHDVFVYGATAGLLLIGNNEKFLYAIEVAFSAELLSAFERVTDYLFKNYFEFFYKPTLEDFPEEKVEAALELRNNSKHKKNAISLHSFWTNYKLWRSLNVVVDEQSIKFPLPPCSRIIPMQCSWWNSTKGPSDTTTRLLDSCEEQLGIRNPQTVATARLLGIGGVIFHRLNQFLSAKDCDAYDSIDSYRKAGNNRTPYWKSIVTICELAGGEIELLHKKQLPPPIPRAVATPLTPKPRTRRSSVEQPANFIASRKTDNTPKQGRKNKSQPHKAAAHALRQTQCLGVTLVSRVGTQGLCKLCRQKTSGCKTPYCYQIGKTCGEKIN